MTLRLPPPLARACLAAATLAACGQAFSSGTGVDAGPSDAAGNDAVALDGSHPDGGGPADGPPDTSHADAPGVPDAPSLDAISVDAITLDAVTGDAVTVDAVTGPPKRVFVSSESYTGDLGGLAGADSSCQLLATTAALTGTYKAWLSSTTATASARLTHAAVPYVLVNGIPVAKDWTALTSGTLLAPIDVSENGGAAPKQAQSCGETNASVVWTSTNPNGSLGTTQGATCSDWTSSGTTNGAVLGFADRTDGSWTAGCSAQGAGSTICGSMAALYCLEQ